METAELEPTQAPSAPEEGQAERTSEEQTVDLYQDPNFRRVQASWTKRLQERDQQLEAMSRQMAEMQAYVERLEEQGLDESERQALELKRAKARLAQYEQERLAVLAEQRRQQEREADVRMLMETHELPESAYTILMQSETFAEAARKAKKLVEERLRKGEEAPTSNARAGRQFVGGTSVRGGDLETQVGRAKTSVELAEMLLQLGKSGR